MNDQSDKETGGDTAQVDAVVSQRCLLVSAMARVQLWAFGDKPDRYRGWHRDICDVLDAVNIWVPVESELPALETPVLVWTGDHSAIARRTDHNGGGWISRDYEATNPTHWQSLPDGPF